MNLVVSEKSGRFHDYDEKRCAKRYFTVAKTWQPTEYDKKGKPRKHDYVSQTIGFSYDFDNE